MTFFEKADILPPLSIFNKGYLSHIIIIYFNLITNINIALVLIFYQNSIFF